LWTVCNIHNDNPCGLVNTKPHCLVQPMENACCCISCRWMTNCCASSASRQHMMWCNQHVSPALPLAALLGYKIFPEPQAIHIKMFLIDSNGKRIVCIKYGDLHTVHCHTVHCHTAHCHTVHCHQELITNICNCILIFIICIFNNILFLKCNILYLEIVPKLL